MATSKHFNPKSGSPPYKSLFNNVSIVPKDSTIAFVSTQWAADPDTTELTAGTENNYHQQAAIVWRNIYSILEELGARPRDIVRRNVMFKEFTDEIGKAAVEAQLSVCPDEWKEESLISALTYTGVSHFHRPGIVYACDLVVAVPAKQ